MTDLISMPSDPAGRAMAARTSFEKESIWLPAFAVQHWNVGQMAIEGKTFTDCLIEGPAVMAIMNGTTFENCAMGVTSDLRYLLYRPVSDVKMSGVIGMANCKFLRCRFVQVGYAGQDHVLESLQSGIQPISEIEAKAK